MRHFIGLTSLLLLVTACASATGRGTARVLPEGESELSAGLELSFGAANIAPARPLRLPWIQLTAGFRHGLGSRLDVGARTWGIGIPGLFAWGAAADLKVALLRSDSYHSGWDIAIAPGAGYHQINQGFAPIHFAVFELPVLFGYNTGGGDQLFFGIRIDDHVMTADDVNTVNLLFFGAQVGYSWKISELFILRPEIVVTWTPVSFNGTLDDPDRRGLSTLQLNLGNVWTF